MSQRRPDRVAPNERDQAVLTRTDFRVFWPVTTRWADNDVFGHLNNAVYYELFDTAINGWLRAQTGDDAAQAAVMGVVAESGCRFRREVAFPSSLEIGMAVTRLGRSSVTYRLGVFDLPLHARAGTSSAAAGPGPSGSSAADGRWVHVYVDAKTRRPVAIPAAVRNALAAIVVAPD